MRAGELTPEEVVGSVRDPELPALTLADLGLIRSVTVDGGGAVEVVLTPTYSGCPATEVMQVDVLNALMQAGYPQASVRFELSPAWTSDSLSAQGRRVLSELGIAPPVGPGQPAPLTISLKCPQCGSLRTRETSHFGSTACKSLWTCRACGEPFEHFKELR